MIELSGDDVAQGRVKAAEVWREATKQDPLAVKILDSQMTQMRNLGLLS